MECRPKNMLDFSTHDVFNGVVAQTYFDKRVMTADKVGLGKLETPLFSTGRAMSTAGLG
jgi:hypothetical protein